MLDSFQSLMMGFAIALSPQNLLYAFIGSFLGTLIGVLPGIGPASGIAILIPMTYQLDPTGAIIMLAAIGYGTQYGGTITSVLMNVPGEAASVVTCIDGYQMAKQGQGEAEGVVPDQEGGACMPYGGIDWLALTPEPTLAPELPICDAHHHFWDFRPAFMPYQRYLLHELAADINIGMPRYGFNWHARATPIGSEELAKAMAPFMTYCIEQFGPNRCMFVSNFPADKLSYSYNVMYNAFKRLSKDYSADERAAMFHDTAARVYRIDA